MGLTCGGWQVDFLSGGTFRFDGGSMFGVVPKLLWARRCPPDENNRILMDCNCLLLRGHGQTVLVDTGYGTANSPREQKNLTLQPGWPLLENLAKLGVTPAMVDMVLLTHLHFDHAGGCLLPDCVNECRPTTFARARYVVQKHEWDEAIADLPELAGAYRPSDYRDLANSGQLELLEGDGELLPELAVSITPGHTPAHQSVLIGPPGQQACFLGEVAPTRHHLRTPWVMAYDQSQRVTRQLKPRLLGEAVDNHWLLCFLHDPTVKAAYLQRDAREEFTIGEVVVAAP